MIRQLQVELDAALPEAQVLALQLDQQEEKAARSGLTPRSRAKADGRILQRGELMGLLERQVLVLVARSAPLLLLLLLLDGHSSPIVEC